MPRYHFNIHDEKGLVDEDGIELPDFATAQLEAVRLTGAMLLDDASLVRALHVWQLSVVDPEGKPLLRVRVDVVDLTILH